MFITNFRVFLLNILFSSLAILRAAAFYGDPENQITIPSTYRSAAITHNNKIYLVGGNRYYENTSVLPNSDIFVYSFSSNGSLQLQTLSPKNPPTSCSPCAGYILPDGDTMAFVNVDYPSYNETLDNVTLTINPGGLGFYHVSNNSWTYGRSPQYSGVYSLHREDFSSGISFNKKFAYLGWGHSDDYDTSMIKYEINNSSNIQSIETNVGVAGGCSITLP